MTLDIARLDDGFPKAIDLDLYKEARESVNNDLLKLTRAMIKTLAEMRLRSPERNWTLGIA